MFCSWSFHFTFSGNTRVELHWKTHLYQMGIFVGCNRSLPPSISPAPIFARSFSRSWSISKIFCFFCCSPILSSAAECKLQQSASAIARDLFIQMVNSFSNVQGKTSQKNYNTNLAALEFLFPCFIWWNLTICVLKFGLGKPNSLKEPSNLSLQLFSIMLNPKLMDRQTSHLNW